MLNPVVIATWPFGRRAVETAWPLLNAGKPALDAVIAGAEAVEDDPAVTSVGFGSIPDQIGRLTLDACVMDGRTLACGGVAGLEHIRHPAAVARKVMEKTPHVLLVGDGAKWFALQQGFPLEMPYTPDSVKQWWEQRPPEKKPAPAPAPVDDNNHDTVTVLGLDRDGHLGGVCTTSGLSYKLPGRVGDSPLIGAGLYVDDEAGAAGATGVGEEIIRIAGSAFIVEQMRSGKSPQEACEAACQRVHAGAIRRGVHPAKVAFLALSPRGEIGAAFTAQFNFRYAVGRDGKYELITAKEVGPKM